VFELQPKIMRPKTNSASGADVALGQLLGSWGLGEFESAFRGELAMREHRPHCRFIIPSLLYLKRTVHDLCTLQCSCIFCYLFSNLVVPCIVRLRSLGCSVHVELTYIFAMTSIHTTFCYFLANRITLDNVKSLKEADLKCLIPLLGPRRHFQAKLEELTSSNVSWCLHDVLSFH
jgi:hypothetical protein